MNQKILLEHTWNILKPQKTVVSSRFLAKSGCSTATKAPNPSRYCPRRAVSPPSSPRGDQPGRSGGKNKMKPTNPNADTYVEKQRFSSCLSQFPANPLVEHPDLTHWGDTLVAHPGLTLLRYTLVRHSCLTLLLDTLVRHSLLDSLTCHSCKTLLLNTLVRHFLLDTSYLALLTWHSSGTLLLDTLVRHSCLTDTLLRHSYMTLLYDALTWHSSETLWLDTLVRHSDLTLL